MNNQTMDTGTGHQNGFHMGALSAGNISSIRICTLFLACAGILLFPADAFATDPLSRTICLVVGWLTGDLGKAIATLGVIVVALGAMLGKVSWGMAITIGVGISIMFSGAQVVQILTDRAEAATICLNTATLSAGALADVLCNLAAWANEPAGRSMATIGVIILGIATLFGKVSYPMALIVSCGMGAFVNAAELADTITRGEHGISLSCSP